MEGIILLMVSIVGFVLSVFILRWAFKVNTMVHNAEMQTRHIAAQTRLHMLIAAKRVTIYNFTPK